MRNPVHQSLNGSWYFWIETWAHKMGPYYSRAEAQRELDKYVKTELGHKYPIQRESNDNRPN